MRLVAIAPNPSIDRFFVVDRLRRGAINRPILEVQVAGGKGLNVARAATALGANVSVLTFLAGHAGRWIADELAREGVPGTYVRTDGETRTCVTIHDAADGRLTELYEAGPTVGADDWNRFETALRAQVNDGKVGLVAVSGSLPPGAPPDGVARIVSIAHAASVPSIVDAGGEPFPARRTLAGYGQIDGGFDFHQCGFSGCTVLGLVEAIEIYLLLRFHFRDLVFGFAWEFEFRRPDLPCKGA